MFSNNNYGQNSVATSTEMDYIPTVSTVDYNRDYLFSNLDSFGVDKGNRPSEDADKIVKDYAKKMLSGMWFFNVSPIYVGIKSHNIFNGEHRRKAINLAIAKGLTPIIHVRFVNDDLPDKELDALRAALNGGKHWNSDDYVEALISAGDSDFKFLKDFCLDPDHPQLHSAKGKPYYNKGAIILGSTYKRFKDAYLEGSWGLTHEDISTAEKRYNEMVRIKKALHYDEVGQDCWIYLGEAWYQFTSNKGYAARIKNLSEGIETFYDALRYVSNANSNKTSEWLGRFVEALEKAERHDK